MEQRDQELERDVALTSSSLHHAGTVIPISNGTTTAGINSSSCRVDFCHRRERSFFSPSRPGSNLIELIKVFFFVPVSIQSDKKVRAV